MCRFVLPYHRFNFALIVSWCFVNSGEPFWELVINVIKDILRLILLIFSLRWIYQLGVLLSLAIFLRYFSKLFLSRIVKIAVYWITLIKVGLSPSKNIFYICFNGSPSNMMKNAFYFILKPFFVLKIFKFLPWPFGHVEKMARWKR